MRIKFKVVGKTYDEKVESLVVGCKYFFLAKEFICFGNTMFVDKDFFSRLKLSRIVENEGVFVKMGPDNGVYYGRFFSQKISGRIYESDLNYLGYHDTK